MAALDRTFQFTTFDFNLPKISVYFLHKDFSLQIAPISKNTVLIKTKGTSPQYVV